MREILKKTASGPVIENKTMQRSSKLATLIRRDLITKSPKSNQGGGACIWYLIREMKFVEG